MPGIGKYTKGKKFQLRSGNNPMFKSMGSSPANMNSFGLSAGDSPYRQDDSAGSNEDDKLKQEVEVTETDGEKIEEDIIEPPKVNKNKTIASKIGNTLVSGFMKGLTNVYGGDASIASGETKFHDPEKNEKTCKDADGNVVGCDSPNAVKNT
jgi:hypothetical protein